MGQLYEVAVSSEFIGAPVKESKSLRSKLVGRLGVGAVVSEQERYGERLRLKKLAGSGPDEGWVSIRLLSKVEESEAVLQDQRRDADHQSGCALASAEREVERYGAAAVLESARKKGKDGEGLITAAVALLAQGACGEALQASLDALDVFRQCADQDGEASASLAAAIARLANKEAVKALQLALPALAYFREAGDRQMEASALSTVANIRLAMLDPVAALTVAKEALVIFKDIGDKPGQAAVELTITDAYMAKDGINKGLGPSLEEEVAVESIKAEVRAAVAAAQSEQVREECMRLVSEALQRATGFGDRAFLADVHCQVVPILDRWLQSDMEVGSGEKRIRIDPSPLSLAEEALAIYKLAGHQRGEAVASQLIAGMSLKAQGSISTALRAAERARAMFLKLGDKRSQGLAAHAVAQCNMRFGEYDFALQVAMEAAVLARQTKDGYGEAAALHTAAHAVVHMGRYPEALRIAKDVQALFKSLGVRQMQQAADSLVKHIEEGIPRRGLGPRTYIQPQDGARLLNTEAVPFEEKPTCVVWSIPVNSQTYIIYCLELLKLVDDLKLASSNTAILVTTQGVMARQLGQELAANSLAIGASTVWALVRTVRLESPRLMISTVDLPPGASPTEIAECLRSAQVSSGPRNEISFFVDRRNRIKSNQLAR